MADLFIFEKCCFGGGTSRVAISLQNGLSPALSRRYVSLYQDAADYNKQGESHTIMNRPFPENTLKRLPLSFIATLKYIGYVKREKPKAILSFIPGENLINLIVSRATGSIPLISLHGDITKYETENPIRLRCEKLLRKTVIRLLKRNPKAKLIVISKGLMEIVHSEYDVPYDKMKVLYNPMDIASIRELAECSDTDSSVQFTKPAVIACGRLVQVKALQHLIRSFAAVRKERDAQLLICGIGEDEAYLRSLATDLGVIDDVHFLGWQDNPYKYMSRSTVFVLSSTTEGTPNVLVEAMASGCPVISSDCSPGVHEIIGDDGEYGLLAAKMSGIRYGAEEPLDSGEKNLAALMQKVIDDKNLCDAYVLRGEERAEFFSLERRLSEYEEFIAGCIDDN